MRGLLRLWPWLFAVAGGWLWATQFEARPDRWAPWIALTPLILLSSSRHPIRFGWLWGLSFWLFSIPWLVSTLVEYGRIPFLLGCFLLLLLAAYLSLFTGLFTGWGGRLWSGPWPVVLVALPAGWVALEWIRGWLFGGFPWNRAGYAWVEVAGALPTSSWIGVSGVSYLVLFANTGLALAVARRSWRAAALGVLIPLTVLAVGGRWGGGAGTAPALARPVSILQPNVPNRIDLDAEAWREVWADYGRLLDATREACRTPGTLVIWPESAAWPFSYTRDAHLRRDLEEVSRGDCQVLFNTTFEDSEGTFNSALLVGGRDEGGEVPRYDKRHLVPWGEFVPLKSVLPFVDALARNAGDFQAATELRLLPWAGEHLGLAICYEIIFPAEVAETVREGATILVTLTNDAWYGDTAAPWQHFRAARFRAAENRRPVLRAAITGVSGIIAPDGSVEKRLGVFREGTLSARVRGRRDLSPHTRAPWLVPILCGLVVLTAMLASAGGGGSSSESERLQQS